MSLVSTLALAERHRRRLETVAAERPNAAAVGASECRRSGLCCHIRPCELGPGDPERLAAHLHLTPAELFRDYLVVDRFTWGLALLPRRVEQTGGVFLTDLQTWDCETPCVFLAPDHTCSVHDAKPVGGRQYACWLSAADRAALPHHPWAEAGLRALGWSGE